MSGLEPTIESLTIPKQLGLRILEIMEEKGKYCTQQWIANRIGMNRITLSKKLHGERELYLFELKRIAEALHFTVERIMKIDTTDDEKELVRLFDTQENPMLALEIAKKISDLAIGFSEKCKALNDLGRVHYFLRDYKTANQIWNESLTHAEKIVRKYGDQDLHNHILANLLISSVLIGDFSHVGSRMCEIENAFQNNPSKLAVASYLKAKIAEHSLNLESAKDYAYRSLECYEKDGNQRSIGKALTVVADYEFMLKEFRAAGKLLKDASKLLEKYPLDWFVVMKDFCKYWLN